MLANASTGTPRKTLSVGNKREKLAGTTGLEPATSDVTGRRSNQLNYVPATRRHVRNSRITRASEVPSRAASAG